MTRREQMIWQRMAELHQIVRSGATEMVGKGIRDASGKIVGRHGGGVSVLYPEIVDSGLSPGQAADAIERGSGIRFNRLVKATERRLDAYLPAAARQSPGRKTESPHAGKPYCVHCRESHTRGQHRFHGPGSFHNTHLFAFNPMPKKKALKKPRRVSEMSRRDRREYERWAESTKPKVRENPSTMIYDATRGIVIEGMQKGSRSKFAGQKFRHKFKEPIEIIGLPNGDVLLRPKGKKK